MAVDWVTIGKFSADIGMTEIAVKKRVGYKSTGEMWPEGLVWVKMQNRIYISRSGWDRWLELKRRGCGRQVTAQFKSNLSTEMSGAESGSSLSPPPLI